MKKKFYDQFLSGFHTKVASSMDNFLRGQPFDSPHFTSVQNHAYKAGDRVLFDATEEAILTHDDAPEDRTEGTVVAVKTASGILTKYQKTAFVKWDDGNFMRVETKFLKKGRKKKGSSFQVSFDSQKSFMGSFVPRSKNANELVHKATQDLWALEKNDEGFTLSRLFDETGKPLRV